MGCDHGCIDHARACEAAGYEAGAGPLRDSLCLLPSLRLVHRHRAGAGEAGPYDLYRT